MPDPNRSTAVCEDAGPWEGLNPPYSTIVADPPWEMKAGPLVGPEFFAGAKGASRPMPYSTMAVADIAALPVGDLVGANAHLYLWVPNKCLPVAADVARAWGFTYSTTLVWAKNVMGGGLGGCFGISTEFILFCRRGQLAATRRVAGTWWNWKRPYNRAGKPHHSGKPPAFLDVVESISPGPYVELFSRSPRLGWDSWGKGYEGVA